jgi:4-amino-4-deoxy-L-arabinose transferase-like glycosyltransferase
MARLIRRLLADDRIALAGLLILAALTRLPGLVQRAEFDGDQGHDVLTLLRFTRDGVVPLLGPPTSIGDFHHGAFYYFLLAPAAALSGSDPVAVVAEIALLGIAAVGVTWWLGRAIGGPWAGLIAGSLLALSPAAIDESTFIWNPNPIPLFAAAALAAAWRAHTTGRARWWVLALASAGVVFQLHVLGIVFVPPILGLLAADWASARSRGDPPAARRLLGAGLAGLGVIALLFVPLLVHELRTDFEEVRHAIAFFTAGSSSNDQLGTVPRFVFTLVRIVGWPVVGLVTDELAGAALAVALVAALGLWSAVALRGEQRLAVRWLLATIAWSAVALTVLAPSLQTVVAGLPNDHYHAFLDPVVVVLLGVGAVGLARRAAIPGVAVGVAIAILAAIGISHWPPPDPNGGWPFAQLAGQRIVAVTGPGPVAVLDVPVFKTPDGIAFPAAYAGATLSDEPFQSRFIVVACDRLFEHVVGAACAGPAEDALIASIAAAAGQQVLPRIVTRFEASPRTSVSIYAVAAP